MTDHVKSVLRRLRTTVAWVDPKRHLTAFRRDESGNAAVTGLYLIFLLAIIGGLSLDHAQGQSARAEAQVVADAAARAGAIRLRDGEDAALDMITEVAGYHRAGLLNMDDITLLSHTEDGFQTASTVDGVTPNAVSVVTRRDKANNNPVNTILMHLSGVDTLNVAGRAIAGYGDSFLYCSGGGFFAAGRAIGNSSNDYTEGFCLHGEQGVQLHNRNIFEEGTVISMPDLDDFQQHVNNPGADDALRSYSHTFTLPDEIPDMIYRMRNEPLTHAGLPDHISLGPIYRDSIAYSDELPPNTLFVVNGDVHMRDARHFDSIAIVAGGDIIVDSNVVLDNVILAAEGQVIMNSNIKIGAINGDFCERGVYGGYIVGAQGIEFNSNVALYGVLLVSGGDIEFNSNNYATDGVYAEAAGNIDYNSEQNLRGCLPGLKDEFTGREVERPVALLR